MEEFRAIGRRLQVATLKNVLEVTFRFGAVSY